MYRYVTCILYPVDGPECIFHALNIKFSELESGIRFFLRLLYISHMEILNHLGENLDFLKKPHRMPGNIPGVICEKYADEF